VHRSCILKTTSTVITRASHHTTRDHIQTCTHYTKRTHGRHPRHPRTTSAAGPIAARSHIRQRTSATNHHSQDTHTSASPRAHISSHRRAIITPRLHSTLAARAAAREAPAPQPCCRTTPPPPPIAAPGPLITRPHSHTSTDNPPPRHTSTRTTPRRTSRAHDHILARPPPPPPPPPPPLTPFRLPVGRRPARHRVPTRRWPCAATARVRVPRRALATRGRRSG